MTHERREELIEEVSGLIVGEPVIQTRRGEFIRSASPTYGEQSWRFYAYSYGRAFDILWDSAYARLNEVINPPLLLLCRHSIELSLKLAIHSLSQNTPPGGHQLGYLKCTLLNHLYKVGLKETAMGSDTVGNVIELLDQQDSRGDRFRYPESISSQYYPATRIDLDELYRVHYLVTSECELISDWYEWKLESELDARLLEIGHEEYIEMASSE